MKKVGICACYGTLNYGSMLQAFATQAYVEKLGFESEFIKYRKKKTFSYVVKQIPRLFNKNLLSDKWMAVKKKIKLSFHPQVKAQEEIRHKAFARFAEEYYRGFSEEYYGYEALSEGAANYSSVLVGSDQLWTPGGLPTNFYNLMFVPDSINKVSYATSFGVRNIPKYQTARTRTYLKRIDYLSVREIRGAEIIHELAERDAKVVVDPTLLFDASEWREHIPHKNIVDGKYIFCYFLGENAEHRKIADELKRATGYKIVTTPHLDSFVKADMNFGEEQLFDIGPDDFVNLIRNAEYVVTDSFHGSVFSILYHKQFVVLDRFNQGKQSRNSRIDSLCSLLGLEQRRYCGDIETQIKQAIDYTDVEEKLCVLRNEASEFLINSLAAGE